MAIESDHPVWKRTRPDHHGGAIRNYMKDSDDDGYPRGPNSSPRLCPDCDTGSGYDSASPESVSWYVSSGDSTPDEEESFFEKPDQSTFDMKGTATYEIIHTAIFLLKTSQLGCTGNSPGFFQVNVDEL